MAINNYRAGSQLLSYGEVFSEEDGLPELVERDVRGELGGIRELIGDYIENVKGVPAADGIVDFTVEDITPENACWKITGCTWDPKKHEQAAKLVREGKLSIKCTEDGRDKNIASITEEDLK